MGKCPTGKSGQRISLKQIQREIAHTLTDISEWDGFIADEYVEWVYDCLSEPNDNIARLFERSKLDPAKPGHWVALLSYIVEIIYQERRGAPVVWTPRDDDRLLNAVYRLHVKTVKTGKAINKEAICKSLQKDGKFNLKTGRFAGERRESLTLLRRVEHALTNLEHKFAYPARRKELNEMPQLREKYEKWLNALRPDWRSRVEKAANRKSRAPRNI